MVNAASSLTQGTQFQQLTAKFHGGQRKKNRKSKMVYTRKMRGGGLFTPYSDYPTAFDQSLPTDIRGLARVADLDSKFTELPAIQRAAGVPQSGGKRSSRKTKKSGGRRRMTRRHGGSSPINAPSMLLSTPEQEAAARLNPQWYNENTVIPNFRGPLPVPGATVPAPAPPAPPAPAKGGKRVMKNRRSIKMRR